MVAGELGAKPTGPKVSAVVLTLNEATNLKRCVDSLRWCDEIVVVDSGSHDGTPELAATLGARVLVHRQPGAFNIADQRNWALSDAELSGEWVLFLDADEVVPEALAAEIRAVAARPIADAYELTPRYLFWGTWLKRTQGFPNWHPRFVRRGRVRYEGGVWEHFEPGSRVGRIAVPYDHYANSKGFSEWLERHDRYSSWDAQRIVEFLQSGHAEALGTERKKQMRRVAARLWPIRFVGRFVYMYFVRGGILEGRAGLAFCLMYAMYEFMTVIKVAELRRKRLGLPL